LQKSRNKSKTINEALDFYFRFQDRVDESKELIYSEFLDEAILNIERGDISDVPLNHDGKIDRKAFMKEI
jgi:hypothetical protein